jgi:hypothetical protein
MKFTHTWKIDILIFKKYNAQILKKYYYIHIVNICRNIFLTLGMPFSQKPQLMYFFFY